jgi:hypothetical protein
MSGKNASLEQIQRWMQSVLMHPGGVAAGLCAPEARAHLDVAAEDLESVITRSAALGSAERLEIYVDAYHERLLECLREEFTATREALGDELYEALAFGYLQHYPSHSYTLNLLGANFARYLAESRLHAQAAPSGAGPNWPDFVIELAAFERALRDVFDGPGSEGGGGLNLEELAAIPVENWGALRFLKAACLQLHRFEHPVHAYWAALKNGEHPAAPPPRTTYLAINRRQYVVERHELSPAQFALLEQLIGGQTLGRAIVRVGELPEIDWLSVEQELQPWFARWTSAGFFVGVRLADV